MAAPGTNVEESNAKGNADYSEDIERDSLANAVDVADIGRVELTEEDVRSHRRSNCS